MSRPTIIINDLDAERIDILLEQPAYAGLPIADALNAELDRAQMTDSNTQLSVMAPVGAALLGLRVGDSIHWELPGGVATHLEVLELEYQPEAAGDYLL